MRPSPPGVDPAGPADDAVLLAAAAAGDAGAFEVLAGRYSARCRRRARQVLGCDDAVDDVLQLVLLTAWQTAGRYDPARGSVATWLLVLTHHKAVDVVRSSERRRLRQAPLHALADLADEDGGPSAAAEAEELLRRLHRAVLELPPAQRQAIAGCFLAERTQQDVATRLGVPLGTVKTRSRAGVLALRQLLAD